MSERIEKYLQLLQAENNLRILVIHTQNQIYEDRRIKVALEREELLFSLSQFELQILNEKLSSL